MSVSFGYILGHFCEFLLFIYYANTSFYPSKKYIISNAVSLLGYFILLIIGLIGKIPLSIFSFFFVNVILLIYCYNISLKNAMFYSLVLNVFSTVGEYIIAYVLGIDFDNLAVITSQQTIAITIGGKLIYLTGIIFFKKFTTKKIIYANESTIVLAFIPVLTIGCLTIIIKIEMENMLFFILCIMFLIMNCIIFYMNAIFNEKNIKLKLFQEEHDRNEVELAEYQLLAEKYESTRIMRHDFHKHINVLKDLIAEDNTEAKKYIQQIQFSQNELNYSQYTDNKILNILLSQKVKECHEHDIEIHIYSDTPKLSFISNIDTVTIFSNMLDNAIEASEYSDKKVIFVNLYIVNNSYTAVKIENYTDKEPVIFDGVFQTQKDNKDMHGIGIKSINDALKKYGSELTCTYDKKEKFFQSIVIIHIPSK